MTCIKKGCDWKGVDYYILREKTLHGELRIAVCPIHVKDEESDLKMRHAKYQRFYIRADDPTMPLDGELASWDRQRVINERYRASQTQSP